MLNIPGEFGRQTVGFVTVTETGDPGFLGVTNQTRSVTLQSGVRFRPLSTEELQGLTAELKGLAAVAGEVWKLTAPPDTATLAVKSTGEIVYDGTDSPDLDSEVFQVEGFIQPKPDMYGALHHVTIMCKKQDS